MIECQICKKQLGSLVGKHLGSHGISSQEYQSMYPGFPVNMPRPQSPETKEKRAAKLRGRKHSAETKSKIGAKHKGKKRSAQEIDKWRISYSEFLQENGGSPQKGYKRSDEFKARMSEVALNRPPELVQQKVEQMWEARRGQHMTEEQKAVYSDARLKFIEENPDKIIPKLFNTKPEREFEAILLEKNIAYKKNYRIGNRLYDFVIGKCVVELDGPYHYEPMMHGNKTMTYEERVAIFEKTVARDQKKTQLAIENGYQVFRVKVTSSLPKDWHKILVNQGWDIF